VNTKLRALLLLTICSMGAVLLSACSKEAKREKPRAARADSAEGDWVKIKSPDNKQVAQIKIEGSTTKVEFGSTSLEGEEKESGKRKYSGASGANTIEVKSEADEFKVRTADGKLLWKVKLQPEKIKIANSEEMNGAISVESKDAERLKVSRGETEIGRVLLRGERGKIKVEDQSGTVVFDANYNRLSAAFGVLLMSEIAENERYIIMAEILARGR